MTLRTSIAALAPLFLASYVNAATKGEIRQIDSAKGLAAVQMHGKIAVGDSLIATAKDNTQCSLPVRRMNGTMATVETSSCSFASQLRVGQTVEPSLIESSDRPARRTAATSASPTKHADSAKHNSEPVQSSGSTHSGQSVAMARFMDVAPASEKIGITAFAFFDTADHMHADYSGADGSAGQTANTDGGIGVGAEYARYAYHFPGWYVNGAYEFGRSWNSIESNGNKYSPDIKPTMTMFLLGGGANVLLTDNFYVKGGLNYNIPSLSSGGDVSDINGKLGFEGGAGMRFFRNFNAELIYRRLNLSASGRNQFGSFSYDLSQSGFVLRGGYLF